MYIPPLRKNGDGRGFVYSKKIANKSHRLYMGKHGTEECTKRYKQFVRRFLADQNPVPPQEIKKTYSIVQLAEFYLNYAEEYYQSESNNTDTFHNVLLSVRYLIDLFGDTLAQDFGPNALRTYQNHLINKGNSRRTINDRVSMIKRMFRWCQSRELLPRGHFEDLRTVENLRKGKTNARETKPIKPAKWNEVKKLFSFVSPTVAAMLQVQYYCGMRPQDVTSMRQSDIDQSRDIWLYKPEHHKTKYLDKNLVKGIPLVAQNILIPFFDRPFDQYLFSPADSDEWHAINRIKRKRKTKLYPCEIKRVLAKKAKKRKHPRRKKYDTGSYARSIRYGIKKAEKCDVIIEPFTPNQLRHSIGTDLDHLFNRQTSSRWLGHSHLKTTEIYVEEDVEKIIQIAQELNHVWKDSDETEPPPQ